MLTMVTVDDTRPRTDLERLLVDSAMDAAVEAVEEGRVDVDGLDTFVDQLVERMNEISRQTIEETGARLGATLIETRHVPLAWEATVREGFESRLAAAWSPALELLDTLIYVASEAGGEFATEQMASRRWTDQTEVLVRIHARACLIAREVLTLIRAGYPSGAHARWRSLHEVAVVAFFIEEGGPSVARSYLEHDVVASWRNLMVAKRADPSYVFPADEEEELRRQTASLSAKYGHDFLDDWGWAARRLRDLGTIKVGQRARFADIEHAVNMGHMRSWFQMANHPVHAGPKGLFFDLGAEANRGLFKFLAGASNTGLYEPGHGAAISLMQATIALLFSDTTLERSITVKAITVVADEAASAFLRCDNDIERIVDIHHGAIRRRGLFAYRRRREMAPGRARARARRRLTTLAPTRQ